MLGSLILGISLSNVGSTSVKKSLSIICLVHDDLRHFLF